MDFDELRSRWADPEFRKSFFGVDEEPTSVVIERVKRRAAREKLWRRVRRFIPRAALAALVGMALIQIFVTDRSKFPLQSVVLILDLAVVSALNLVYKAMEKYEEPITWLNHKEFLLNEGRRMGRNIYYDLWISVLLGVAIVLFALYVGPFLSGRARIIGWAAAGAAILALQIYYCRAISEMKRWRACASAQLDELMAD